MSDVPNNENADVAEVTVSASKPNNEVILRVAKVTELHQLATAMRKYHEEGARVVLSCVGVQTVNQAVKATAIANSYTAPNGFVFLLLPTFYMDKDRDNPNVERNVIRLVLIKHLIGT